MDLDAQPLGEVQVVLDQCVLGAVPAAGHALAALEAASALGPGAPEVGVRAGTTRLLRPVAPVEHPDRREPERGPHAEPLADLADDLVGRGEGGVRDDTEHPPGLVVEGGELGLPVRDGTPLRVPVERVVRRLVERVRVVERTTSDARPGQDEHVVVAALRHARMLARKATDR
ncbi:hypothetical protein GCM10025862_41480 [Arsenicicoccus piscis]|uniref:DUF222 domain-containing protein n=1 Tax=Arsenicicoccus piscis TaxID=673954 RepID=A0ABQ6HX26_9MICO|nr:hypothetical protein GCM10025862_41480 [Arsenicicoccus piscis]